MVIIANHCWVLWRCQGNTNPNIIMNSVHEEDRQQMRSTNFIAQQECLAHSYFRMKKSQSPSIEWNLNITHQHPSNGNCPTLALKDWNETPFRDKFLWDNLENYLYMFQKFLELCWPENLDFPMFGYNSSPKAKAWITENMRCHILWVWQRMRDNIQVKWHDWKEVLSELETWMSLDETSSVNLKLATWRLTIRGGNNWVQPSTYNIIYYWPQTNLTIHQPITTVCMTS